MSDEIAPPESGQLTRRHDLPSSLAEAIRVFFTFESPRLFTLAVGMAWIFRIWLGGWTYWDLGITAVIVAVWPFQEWFLHVNTLHFKPKMILGRQIDLHSAKAHRRHHQDPSDLNWVFVPRAIVLGGFIIHGTVWNLVMPTTQLAFTTIAVYMSLALQYEWVHYLIHTAYIPKSRRMKELWRSHRLHHYKNENYWYGVSMLLGDRILGTKPDKSAVTTSPTCRTLGEEARY